MNASLMVCCASGCRTGCHILCAVLCYDKRSAVGCGSVGASATTIYGARYNDGHQRTDESGREQHVSTIAQQEFSRQLFDLTHWGFGDPLRSWSKDWFRDEDDEAAQRNIPLYDADYLQAKLREALIDPAPLDDPWRLEIAVFKLGAYATLTREATSTKYARGGDDATEALLRLC